MDSIHVKSLFIFIIHLIFFWFAMVIFFLFVSAMQQEWTFELKYSLSLFKLRLHDFKLSFA